MKNLAAFVPLLDQAVEASKNRVPEAGGGEVTLFSQYNYNCLHYLDNEI